MERAGNQRLALLLSMAMFVLVVDTSIMNVSISSVVHDLDTDVSSVQAAISLEALVSAAFILIGSKVADLIGRKRAYVLGLLGYAVGAISMALAQSVLVVFVFWAMIGGIGASLLLPSMQSLIHGNFEGDAQKRVYALVGAAAAIAAAVGPLLGGFITTYLSWRVAFLLEAVIIGVVLLGIGLVRDVPYTGSRAVDVVGASLSVVAMGGLVLGILLWQEGAESVGAVLALGVLAMAGARVVARAPQARRPRDPDRSRSAAVEDVPSRDLRADAPADRAGRHDDRAADLLADGPRVQRDDDGVRDRTVVAQHVRDGDPRGQARRPETPRNGHPGRVRAPRGRGRRAHRRGAPNRFRVVPAGALAARRIRARTPRVAVEQLHAVTDLRGARERGGRRELRAGSFGLSFGLAFAGAIMLAALSFFFTNMAEASDVLTPAQQEQVADALEHDAEVMSNTALEQELQDQPKAVRDEIIDINTDARPRALQVALLIPLVAALLGFVVSFRMARLPDPEPSDSGAAAFG
jgi:MFS family permease